MNLSSHSIGRREFLSGAGGLALAVAAPHAAHASPRPFLTSETGTLRKVLVHPAVVADHASCAIILGRDPFWQEAVDEVVAQHADMTAKLESGGAQVLRVEDLLETAVESAKRQGAWQGWLRIAFPDLAGSKTVSAATLLARDSGGQGGQAMHGLSYVRDFAVMLPKGLMLCNVADAARSRQADLFRFMVAFAPALQSYPILFDVRAEGLRAEGGDVLLLDRRTLLVGVGNHTDARIAPILARRTEMDVVAVSIRNADPAKWRLDRDPLRDFFLHLNSSVAQVAPDHVVALPWLFEAEHGGRADPLIAAFGTVRQYRASSGERVATVDGLKLVDYLRGRGTRVGYIGGRDREDWARLRSECARDGFISPTREHQAANMIATGPDSLLAFEGAERTHAALRGEGVQLRTVTGPGMWRGYGGPHCLTLPLERA